jgi:hypothetical protein
MEPRIDYYPTHERHGFRLRRGHPLPFGTAIVPNGVKFSVFSGSAVLCTLVLFRKHEPEPTVEIEFPQEFKNGVDRWWCRHLVQLVLESRGLRFREEVCKRKHFPER